jgi:hypothetical protein
MASVTEKYSMFDVRKVVRLSQVEEMSESGILRRLLCACGPNVFSRKEVSVWCDRFQDGRTALNDDPEGDRGGPRTSHTVEIYVIVEGLTRGNRRVKFHEIAEVTGAAYP